MSLDQFSALELVLVVGEVIIVAIGLVASYLAYAGYRKHGSRPMLFLAAGFVLLVGGPAVFVALLLVTPMGETAYALGRQAVTVGGFLCIFYALWTDG